MSLQEALTICRDAGYHVTKPRSSAARTGGTVNPHGHPYPHAKLINITLTSIARLSKNPAYQTIGNNDPRNYSITGKVPA